MPRKLPPASLAREWEQIVSSPSGIVPGGEQSFASMRLGTAARDVIRALLRQIWADGWVIGAAAAWKLSQHPSVKEEKEIITRCDAGHEHNSPGAGFFLIRSRSKKGKRVYLLHKRKDGSWGLPGGGLHEHEPVFEGALRETEEEIGPVPKLRRRHRLEADHGGWVATTFVMDARKPFMARMDETTTPEEVQGWGWFTKKEMRELPLHGPFDDTWHILRTSVKDTHVNIAGGKAWRYRKLLPQVESAPGPPEPRLQMMRRLMRAGIPRYEATALAGHYTAWADQYEPVISRGIVHTVSEAISSVLGKMREGQLTAAEAVQPIRDAMSAGWRAARIGTTELTRAASEAASHVYEMTGEHLIEWVTAQDAKVCRECQKNAAAGPVPLGTPFPSGATIPPGHVNCRCAVVPARQHPQPEIAQVSMTSKNRATNPWLAFRGGESE